MTRGADYAVCEKSVTKHRRCAIFIKSFIAVGVCGLFGCRVTGGVHRVAAEQRGQHVGKRGEQRIAKEEENQRQSRRPK